MPDSRQISWTSPGCNGLDTVRTGHSGPGIDAIVLITADLAGAVKSAWSALLSEVLQATPERMVVRLTPGSDDGSQSSRNQRTLFGSFTRPPKYGRDGGSHASDTVRLLHDIRLLDFDYDNRKTAGGLFATVRASSTRVTRPRHKDCGIGSSALPTRNDP